MRKKPAAILVSVAFGILVVAFTVPALARPGPTTAVIASDFAAVATISQAEKAVFAEQFTGFVASLEAVGVSAAAKVIAPDSTIVAVASILKTGGRYGTRADIFAQYGQSLVTLRGLLTDKGGSDDTKMPI